MIDRARQELANADRLLIAAGAGMGVDSGLPDFRGDEGFWKAYPPFRGKPFYDMANPRWFATDPEIAWGFYGHRMNLYRATTPHAGFSQLLNVAQSKDDFSFVFTSNVDGHFQAAGFDPERILECHGSIHHWQCSKPCGDDIWPAGTATIEIDEDTFRCTSPLPKCRNCDAIARPNVLMFGDAYWLPHRSDAQERRYEQWMAGSEGKRLIAVECGAGTAVPTVRYETVKRADLVIRINPREPGGGSNVIGIAKGARDTINELLDCSE